jgi:hypothetical protein
MQRSGQSGPVEAQQVVTVTVPGITDGDTADVALPANASFINAGAVRADFNGAPLANLGIVAAWVSAPSTGVVTIRFSALTGNVSTGDVDVKVTQVL